VNGKEYDARSGALLGNASRTQPAKTIHPRTANPVHRAVGGSVDGMVNAVRQSAPRQKTTPHHVNAHQLQPTKTLMRRAVTPPQPGALHPVSHKPVSKPISPVALQPQAAAAVAVSVTPKLSSTSINPFRAQRATVANRSHNVAHFRSAPQAPTPHQVAVQPAIAQPIAQQPTPKPQLQPTYTQPVQQLRPQPQVKPQPVAPVAIQAQQPRQQSMRPIAAARRPYAQPAAPAAASNHNDQQEEQDLFAQALAQAKSHEQPEHRESAKKAVRRKGSKTRRFAIAGASLAVFVALSGFVAFQNRDQIQLQMASAKAGFAASTPLFMPPGYALDNMTYATGSVATSYNSAGKAPFSITQKKSNWNSQTLLDNFVATSGDDYRGFQSNGRTIYIYGKGNATWVNGGIWYQIKGADKLSDEQLVKIATSM